VIPDADADFCDVTTTGRKSGRQHRIEIWFATAVDRDTIYLLAGGRERADWVRNLQASPDCAVLIGERTYVGHARIVEGTDEDEVARRLVHDKYARGDELTSWRGEALPIAIDLDT
jgi:deazaflavin-dependent oxidoreductase (nitroreductase family)